jgi:pimeloyl-ACP methyl ester carboxylesterase
VSRLIVPRPPARPPASTVGGRRSARRLAAVVLVGVLGIAGCTTPKHQVTVSNSPAASAAAGGNTAGAPAGFETYYGQPVDWAVCGDFECAKIQAPMNWSDPKSAPISLALARSKATGPKRLGSLLVNPGGPGASGVDLLTTTPWLTSIGAGLRASYDIVSFDPRGVSRSTPVKCLDGAGTDSLNAATFDFSKDADVAKAEALYADFAKACQANTGDLLGHVDTVSAAKDLDLMRGVLGDSTLTYLGYSYGTQLGSMYAELFPKNVGRMVLDGAIDPTQTTTEMTVGQATGFENALRAYVKDCQAGPDCPLTGNVDDGLKQIHDLTIRARSVPLKTGTARPLTAQLAFYGIAVAMYSNTNWPPLTKALRVALRNNDGSMLLSLADYYFDRNADGTYASNSTEAFTAVNCLDEPSTSDLAAMRAEAAQVVAAAPTLGESFAYSGVICKSWPYPRVESPTSFHAVGAPTIVVIGTTNDPATPYASAQALAKELDKGVLLTFKGEGHTAYGRSNTCIIDAVDTYFVKGTPPADGKTC